VLSRPPDDATDSPPRKRVGRRAHARSGVVATVLQLACLIAVVSCGGFTDSAASSQPDPVQTAIDSWKAMSRLQSVQVSEMALGYMNQFWCTANTLHHIGQPLGGNGLYVEEIDIGTKSWRRTSPTSPWKVVVTAAHNGSFVSRCLVSQLFTAQPPPSLLVVGRQNCPTGSCFQFQANVPGLFGTTDRVVGYIDTQTLYVLSESAWDIHSGTAVRTASFSKHNSVSPMTAPT
jgi:hypothetical protein